MTDVNQIVNAMCEKYQMAVNANDSGAYRKLFAANAIRIPPGSEPERGPEEIANSEQKDYDLAEWRIRSRPIDGLRIDDNWVFGIVHVDATTTARADGTVKSFKATKTWLLHREPSGDWLINRQMWNLK
jgi:ketosteroid isomerase-like protein